MKKVLLMILVVLSLTVIGFKVGAASIYQDGYVDQLRLKDHNNNIVDIVYNWNGITNPNFDSPTHRPGYEWLGYFDGINTYGKYDLDWYLDLATNNDREDPYIDVWYRWEYRGSTTVNYYDWNNTLLKTEQVLYGDDGTPPTPTRTGYNFVNWDQWQDIYPVMSAGPINLTAVYQIASYTVTFKDWDGKTLKTQTVIYGNDATPPANPTREGYTFTDWNGYYDNVHQNEIVTATYIPNTYTVIFKDWDDLVLKTETVNYLANATPPANPIRSGYKFIGWSGGFYTYVTENRTLTASYLQSFTLTFDLAGGLPQYNDFNFTDGDVLPIQNYTPTRDGYVFVKWLVDWDDIAFTDGDLVANDLKLSNGTVTAVWDVSGATIQNAYNNGLAQGLAEGEAIGWQEAFEYFYANGFDGYQQGYVNDGSYTYQQGYSKGTTDSIDNGNAIERFIPGILGVLFGFFFQLASISVMGISVLDVLALLFALGIVLLIIKIFTGK